MKVRELMTPSPVSVEPDTTVEEIATMMKQEDIGCIPVVEEDGQVAGVITDRDIVVRCIAEGKDPAECRADDIISPQTVCIGPNADAKEAAQLMGDRQIRRLPVVENGKLVGMLSLGDVAVKQHDDRLSGDVLQEVSEGVKSSGDAREMATHQGGSRSGVKTSTADRAEAGPSSSGKTTGSQRNLARPKRSGGRTPEGALGERRNRQSEDARPTASFEYGSSAPTGAANRETEEADRQEKVLPFAERHVNRVGAEADRTREAAEPRSPGKDTKKAG